MSVSVIIPAFNAAAYIERALDSVLSQTSMPEEIVVVDDGSTDRTPQLVEAYRGQVRLISQENQGVSAARNAGVSMTSGEFIAFLDADDFWQPDKLQKLLEPLAQNDAVSFAYSAMKEWNPDGSVCRISYTEPAVLKEKLRICNPGLSPSCVVIRRRAYQDIGGFDRSLRGCEDWDLWIRLLQWGPCVGVHEPLTNYQLRSDGLSSDADLMFENFERLLNGSLLEKLRPAQRVLWKRRALSYQLYKAALTSRASGHASKEMRYFLRSLAVWPSPLWHPRRFKSLAVSLLRSR